MTKFKSFLEKNEEELIQALGLSDAEVAVYLATLELGEANIQEISRKSGVKRTSIYNFIDGLKDRHLLSEVKKRKRKLYSAISPHHLLDEHKTKASAIERLIPQLLAIQSSGKNKPRVSFYEGIQGISEVYRTVLRDKQTLYAWEDLDRTLATMGENFVMNYPAERARLKIPARCIDRDSKFARDWTSKNNERLMRESRFIQSEEFGTEIDVFGNKVAFFSFRKDQPFAVLIEDKGIATAVRVAWQELWDRLPSVSAA